MVAHKDGEITRIGSRIYTNEGSVAHLAQQRLPATDGRQPWRIHSVREQHKVKLSEWHSTSAQRPVWFEQNERLGQQAIIWQTALAIPPAIEVRHQWADGCWFSEHEALHMPMALLRQALYVAQQRRLKAPFRLRHTGIGRWAIPAPPF